MLSILLTFLRVHRHRIGARHRTQCARSSSYSRGFFVLQHKKRSAVFWPRLFTRDASGCSPGMLQAVHQGRFRLFAWAAPGPRLGRDQPIADQPIADQPLAWVMVSVAPRNELFYFSSCLPAAAQIRSPAHPKTRGYAASALGHLGHFAIVPKLLPKMPKTPIL